MEVLPVKAAAEPLQETAQACSRNSRLISFLQKSPRNVPQHVLERWEQGTENSKETEVLAWDASHPQKRLACKYMQVIVNGVKEPTQMDHRAWSVLSRNIISRLFLHQACQKRICLLTTDNRAPEAPTHTTREWLWNMMLSLERRGERGWTEKKAEQLSETSHSPIGWAVRAVQLAPKKKGKQRGDG